MAKFTGYLIPALAALVLTLGGTVAFLGTQNGGLRERIGQLQEECNVRVVDSARKASELAASMEREAHKNAIESLKRQLEFNKEMSDALEKALQGRDRDLNSLRTRLREAAKNETEDGCLDATVPSSVWMQFRKDSVR